MNRIIVIAMFSVAIMGAGFDGKGVWIIDANSQLTIQGSTNVNKFTCMAEYRTGTDTLQYIEDNVTSALRFTRSRMTIPVDRFDCGAKPISKDFRKTLRADRYPNMEINFISLQTLNFKDKSNVKGVVDITLAGTAKRYTICYLVLQHPNGNVQLNGVQAVNFSDFQLVAPEKLNGLIRVKEGLTVEFDLLLKEI